MNIHHIAIWTEDIETVKNFYIRYFNCKANEKYENVKKGFSSYFLMFLDGTRIELMKRNDIVKKAEGITLGYSHIAIDAGSRSNVDELTRKIEKDGYKIESHPRITGDGYYESTILDPENNRIELVSL